MPQDFQRFVQIMMKQPPTLADINRRTILLMQQRAGAATKQQYSASIQWRQALRAHTLADWEPGNRRKPSRGAPTFQSKRRIAQPSDLATRVWLTRVEAAAYLRISARTFDRRRRDGKYPPSGQSSSRRPLWFRKDLDESAASANRGIDPIMALIDAED